MTEKLIPVKDYQSRIDLQPPRLVQHLKEINSEFLPNILEIAREVEQILNNEIPKTFPNYTLHDISHSIRIMENMYTLIIDIKKLGELDVVLLIYSALFHDIGMSVTEEEKDLIRKEKYLPSGISYRAVLKKYNSNDIEAMQEYIRKIHAKRSALKVLEYKQKLKVPSHPIVDFSEEISIICQGHTEDSSVLIKKIKSYDEKGKYKYNPLYCSLLLRLADITDCSSQRTPPCLYKVINPQGVSDEEWKGHFAIENSEIIKIDEKSNQRYIAIYGKCNDAYIHRKILDYISWINREIQNSIDTTFSMHEKYHINLKYPLENHIEPIGYTIPDLKLTIDFYSITNLLMGENIYGSRALGLRELIQNSIDACKVRKENDENTQEYGEDIEPLSIKIIMDSGKNLVTIKDNGTGMTIDILKNYFLNIGLSYYKSEDFTLRNYKYIPIGNFGIGFLACFMLSRDVIVKTRHFQSPMKYEVSLTKDSPYICLKEEQDPVFKGTEVILNYDEFLETMGNDVKKVEEFLKTYFITDGIDMTLVDRKNKNIIPIVNSMADKSIFKETEQIIDLSDYLVDIDGYIGVDVKKHVIKKSLNDIPYEGTPYYYDGEKITRIEDIDNFDFEKLYQDCKVRYLMIPIINEDNTGLYDKFYEVLEDIDDTIKRIESDLDWITIFLDRNVEEKIFNYIYDKQNNYILYNLKFEDLFEFGQAEGYPVKVYAKVDSLIFNSQQRLFLPFYKDTSTFFYFPSPTRLLYIRNVLCHNFPFKHTELISSIIIKDMKINVLNKLIIPDISRNRLNPESEKLLNYALNKAIHLWAMDNLQLTLIEKNILEEFVTTFYQNSNALLRQK